MQAPTPNHCKNRYERQPPRSGAAAIAGAFLVVVLKAHRHFALLAKHGAHRIRQRDFEFFLIFRL